MSTHKLDFVLTSEELPEYMWAEVQAFKNNQEETDRV